MIIKLDEDQITRHWDVIKFSILESVPPITYGSQNTINNMLKALLTGQMQCWVMLDKDKQTQGVVTTTMTADTCSGVKNLMIYSVYGLKFISDQEWVEHLQSLRKFAAAKGCHRIISYTAVARLIKLARNLGGNTEYTFIALEV